MFIVIDSSHNLQYTGIISGNYANVITLIDDFEKVFSQNNVAHKYHWSKLSQKTRQKLRSPLAASFAKAPKVNLNILHHAKPKGITDKEWYLNHLPARIAQRLERWLVGKGGSIELIVDDDYNVIRGGSGTKHFIEALLRQISVRLTNKQAVIRYEEKIKATIKQANGNVLTFYASIADKGSKQVGLVDVYLGLYLSDKKLFEGLGNVYHVTV